MDANLKKMLKDKLILVPFDEYLDLRQGRSSGSRAPHEFEHLEAQADLLARENTELLEESHRLEGELKLLRKQLEESDAGRYHNFIVWLATVGRTGNFAWNRVRTGLREGRVDDAIAWIEENQSTSF